MIRSTITVQALSLTILLVVLGKAAPNVGQANNKLVRIALSKKSSMQNGELGQPVTSYLARVDVGTPAKTFKMLVDVNARETWLPHYLKLGVVFSRLNYKEGYAKQQSSTGLKEPNETYKLDYKGCELSGKAYKDVFAFKDVTESLQPAKWEQRFLAMSSASNDKFTKFEGADGVLALNPWPISEIGSELINSCLARANLTGELKFALALDADVDTETGGELTFGGANPFRFSGDLRYHRVVAQHSWEVSLQNVMLGASSVGSCLDRRTGGAACTAVLSTTRNDIYGPTSAIQDLLKLLGYSDVEENFKGNSLYEIDCLRVADAPPLTFVIEGAYYALPATSYIKKKVEGYVFKSANCYVALLSNGSNNRWELGTNFISHFYAVFDINMNQVALGPR